VWCPVAANDINTLENVQRYFTNKISECTYLPYSQRLTILSLNSLQHRRAVSDLVTLHALISGRSLFTLTPHLNHIPPSITRGHNLKIDIPLLKYSQSKQNFLSRTAPCWNTLPFLALSSSTSVSFHCHLSRYLKNPYLPNL